MCGCVHHSFFTMNLSFVGHSSSFELPRGRAILVGEAPMCRRRGYGSKTYNFTIYFEQGEFL